MGKLSSYDELTSLAADDRIPVVDRSDTTQSASGTTKYVVPATLGSALGAGALPPGWIDASASPYNVVADGTFGANTGTDNTSAIQAALDAAGDMGALLPDWAQSNATPRFTGGGVVMLPPGIIRTGQLSIPNRVTLAGSSWGTALWLKNGVNDDAIVNADHAVQCSVRDLAIYGNASNQTAGHGIHFSNDVGTWDADLDESYDARHHLHNVLVYAPKQNGVVMYGRGSNYLHKVEVFGAGEQGFNLDQDNHLQFCIAEWCGYEGFYIGSGGGICTNCKSFFNGQVTADRGKGFKLEGGYEYLLSGCSAQDNWSDGFAFENVHGVTAYIAASSNGAGVASRAGILLNNAQGCWIAGVSQDLNRAMGGTRQAYALRLTGTNTANVVDLGDNNGSNTAGESTGTTTGNRIIIGIS